MTYFIILLPLIPLIGFLISLVVPSQNERLISGVAFITTGLQLFTSLIFTIFWIQAGSQVLTSENMVIFRSGSYEYALDLFLDRITLVFLLTGAVLTFLVTTYSRRYLHREEGYKRFFYTILLFFSGYNITIFSGNFETLFIGWEILGITSFLLISFYRDRYLPVKNAVKVFSVYRLADVSILLAIWASHHFWSTYITFEKISDYQLVDRQLQAHDLVGTALSVMIVLAAAAKSAQLPFSSWLPRAMEGPTPSTAIFYGALSVNMGVFLLLRTWPFWQHQPGIRLLIGAIGLSTSLVATGIARVQSSVKSQIAYASISQIGLIFVEIAAGLENLALLHFAGNAFLRAIQLLISPSIVSQRIGQYPGAEESSAISLKRFVPERLWIGLYMLSLKEWGMDLFMYRYLWNPFKKIGGALGFLTARRVGLFLTALYLAGIFFCFNRHYVPLELGEWLSIAFSLLGLMMAIKSFSERKNVWLSWILVITNHLWVALAVSCNKRVPGDQLMMYLSGVVIAGLAGYWCLLRLRKMGRHMGLGQFHGHIQRHKRIGIVFFLSCLGLSGFPITPTFIGEDLVFSHIHQNQVLFAFFVSLGCIINGLSLIRIYARVFLGPGMRSQYELNYRSS